MTRREIAVRVDQVDDAPARLRTADDVLLNVGRVPAGGKSPTAALDLASELARLPWADRIEALRGLRDLPTRPQIDVVAAVEGRRRYNRFAVENALGPLLALAIGGRYLRRTPDGREPGDPELTCRVFVRANAAVAAIRLTDTPLHRRTYKLDTSAGTLHPPTAAAMVRLANLGRDDSLLDPFCGDGTIPIEAALTCSGLRVAGSDLDPARIAAAKRNAERAEVEVVMQRADAATIASPCGGYDALVTNPPWNVAVDAAGSLASGLESFWDHLPGLLTAQGRLVAITTAKLDAPSVLRGRGYAVTLAAQVRLAGRLCHLVLAAPPGQPPLSLPPGAAAWRERAIAEGIVTPTGF